MYSLNHTHIMGIQVHHLGDLALQVERPWQCEDTATGSQFGVEHSQALNYDSQDGKMVRRSLNHCRTGCNIFNNLT